MQHGAVNRMFQCFDQLTVNIYRPVSFSCACLGEPGSLKSWSERLVKMKVRDLFESVTCRVVLSRHFRDGKKIGRNILYEGGLRKCPKDLLELNVFLLTPEGEQSLYLDIEVE